jgi:hypothetical protein
MSSVSSEREPGKAIAHLGQVLLDGPDGVAVAMTPEAAIETAKNLLAAAEEALKQFDDDRGADRPHS